jgi:DNA-binding response OmpR family regulator
MLDLPDRRMAGSPAQGHGRKAIHGAGILIVQPDDAVASAWREALVDFGMAGVRTVASIEEAIETIIARPPSAIVVALEAVADSHRLMNRLMARQAGGLSDVPIVLVTPQPTRAIVIAAANAGFDAVLPYPLHPRLIYRRMGSLMQKARRSARKRGGPLIADARLGEQVG